MHLSRWAAADPRFPFPHLRERSARKRGQGVRGAERRAAGACAWALLLSRSASSVRGPEPERVPAAAVRRAGVPQVLRGARSPARVPAGSGARRDACGNFSPAPQVRVPAFRGAGPAAGSEYPPRPHFRLPPLPRSRLPGPLVPREPRRHSPTRLALLAPTPPPPPVGSAPREPAGCGRCSG